MARRASGRGPRGPAWAAVLYAFASLACGRGSGTVGPSDDAKPLDGGATGEDASPHGGDGAAEQGPPTLEPAPADFLFLVDSSASWIRHLDRWEGLKGALSGFLAEHGSQHELAAMSFPKLVGAEASCDSRDYESLGLDWPTLPSTIDTFVGALPIQGKSSLGPALSGAIGLARRHHAGRARSSSVILLTDATQSDDETCETSDWANLATIAAQGFTRGLGPSVHIDVVSVMGRAVSGNHFGVFAEIATRGGGSAAFVNGSSEDVKRSARKALEWIRDRRTTCTMTGLDEILPEELTLKFPDGAIEMAHRVPDAQACDGLAFYVDDPDWPTTVTLCGGEAGIGGYCELTFIRAGQVGRPTVTVSRSTPRPATVP
jgi:hypothetical protein